MKNKKVLFLNKKINFLIIKKKKLKKLYLFTQEIFLTIFLEMDVFLNKNLNCLVAEKNIRLNFFYLNKFLKDLIFLNYSKISFNGKGFKLKKISNFFLFNFNNSHIKGLIQKKIKIIKNNKNSFLLFFKGKNNNLLFNFLGNLFHLNVYTKRGIKFEKKIVMQKKIKKK